MKLHHLQKKTHHKHLRFPLSYTIHKIVDVSACAVGIISPVMTLPQVYLVYTAKTTAGVSLASWSSYTLISFVWFAYAVIHKSQAILISSVLGFIVDIAVVIGILKF